MNRILDSARGTWRAASIRSLLLTLFCFLTSLGFGQSFPTTLTVNSSPITGVTVTASPADANGAASGSTNFTLSYPYGTNVTVTAPALVNGDPFSNWTVDGVAQPAGQTAITVSMINDHTVNAIYTIPLQIVTVQSQNPNSGVTINATPDVTGIASGSTTFTLTYLNNSRASLTAPPTVGNNPFLNWKINGVNQAAGATTVTLSVTGAVTAIAVYQPTNVLTIGSQLPNSGVPVTNTPADNNRVSSGTTQYTTVYNTGTAVTLTAPATSGANIFQNWTVNGTAQTAGATTISTTVNADTTAIAVYALPVYALSVQSSNPARGVTVNAAPADNNGQNTGTTTFGLSYNSGTRITLAAPAAVGNNPFLNWVLNGVNQPAGQTGITFTITGATTALAVYQATNVLTIGSQLPNSGVVVTNAPADNNRVSSGTTQYVTVYNTGTSVTLTAPATAGGNIFQNWTINGTAQAAGATTVTTRLNADTSAIAVYALPNYSLTVQSTNPASGVRIASAPADNGGLSGGTTTFALAYVSGTSVTLTAPAAVGNNPFSHWVINGTSQPNAVAAVTFPITSNTIAVAAYQPTNVLTVTSVNPASGVSISLSPADDSGATTGTTPFPLTYYTGTKVTLTAPALQGRQIFANWTINGVAQPAGQTSVVVTVGADTSAVAIYNTPIYTITTSVLGTHATISPTPSATVLLGGNLTFTATPVSGYVVNTWLLDGVVVQTGGNTFQLTNVQSNHALQVTINVILVFHPADTNKNAKLEVGEITAYGAAWKHGATWPIGPSPIPQSFVTVAVSLWKTGEVYTYDPSKADPNGWIPLASAPFSQALSPSWVASAKAGESALKALDGSYSVTLTISPPSGTKAITVEEFLPAKVQILQVDQNGFFDPKTRVIRWGPFLDGASHTLTYRAKFNKAISTSGVASFDGKNVAITRDRSAGGK